MDKIEFDVALRQALLDLYDFSALNRSPLRKYIIIPSQAKHEPAGQILQREITQTIEQLRPDASTPANSVSTRTYEILHYRFLEGMLLKELCSRLQVGERQVRREIRKAEEILSSVLWDRWIKNDPQIEEGNGEKSDVESFSPNLQPLTIQGICGSVLEILSHLDNPPNITSNMPEEPVIIRADRSLVRQGLLALLKAGALEPSRKITLSTRCTQQEATIQIHFSPALSPEYFVDIDQFLDLLEKNQVKVQSNKVEGEGLERIDLVFTRVEADSILIVDDDENAIHLYQRYLAEKPFQIITVQDGRLAVRLAQERKPKVIFLDVLLPNVDGWDILQALKESAETKEIPVLICSAWGDPDIARSLGAHNFLRKPFTKDVFLQMLQNFL